MLIIRRINCINTSSGIYQTVCVGPSGMQVRFPLRPAYQTATHTQSDIYQMMYWYNWFSWWWALRCSKHVEKWNKHIKKKCVNLAINTKYTEINGQQNINFLMVAYQAMWLTIAYNIRIKITGKLSIVSVRFSLLKQKKVIGLSRFIRASVWGRSCGKPVW